MPGYKGTPSQDPVEQSMREKWYAEEGYNREVTGSLLAAYLWERAKKQVADDRLRFPKKKRNLPVPADVERRPGGRYLP